MTITALPSSTRCCWPSSPSERQGRVGLVVVAEGDRNYVLHDFSFGGLPFAAILHRTVSAVATYFW
jgi:hypothetical protein